MKHYPAFWQRAFNTKPQRARPPVPTPGAYDAATDSNAEIAEVERCISTRPCQALGLRMPIEVFLEETRTRVTIWS